MPTNPVRGRSHRRQVRFISGNRSGSTLSSTVIPSEQVDISSPAGTAAPAHQKRHNKRLPQRRRPEPPPPRSLRLAKMTDTDNIPSHPGVPALYQEQPPIRNSLVTQTVEAQNETVEQCLPFLKGSHSSQKGPFNEHGVPALQRNDHVTYLHESLEEYPADWVALDASRPWMSYWALAALSLLGEDVTKFRSR